MIPQQAHVPAHADAFSTVQTSRICASTSLEASNRSLAFYWQDPPKNGPQIPQDLAETQGPVFAAADHCIRRRRMPEQS